VDDPVGERPLMGEIGTEGCDALVAQADPQQAVDPAQHASAVRPGHERIGERQGLSEVHDDVVTAEEYVDEPFQPRRDGPVLRQQQSEQRALAAGRAPPEHRNRHDCSGRSACARFDGRCRVLEQGRQARRPRLGDR
jgi:hypothetical protein